LRRLHRNKMAQAESFFMRFLQTFQLFDFWITLVNLSTAFVPGTRRGNTGEEMAVCAPICWFRPAAPLVPLLPVIWPAKAACG